MEVIIIVLMCVLLLWIGRIFYAIQKGLNEIIVGLTSIDERLSRPQGGLDHVD